MSESYTITGLRAYTDDGTGSIMVSGQRGTFRLRDRVTVEPVGFVVALQDEVESLKTARDGLRERARPILSSASEAIWDAQMALTGARGTEDVRMVAERLMASCEALHALVAAT